MKHYETKEWVWVCVGDVCICVFMRQEHKNWLERGREIERREVIAGKREDNNANWHFRNEIPVALATGPGLGSSEGWGWVRVSEWGVRGAAERAEIVSKLCLIRSAIIWKEQRKACGEASSNQWRTGMCCMWRRWGCSSLEAAPHGLMCLLRVFSSVSHWWCLPLEEFVSELEKTNSTPFSFYLRYKTLAGKLLYCLVFLCFKDVSW